VWRKLRKENDKDNPPKILYNMEFEKDPLSFLLIFCDNVQEWGRPSKTSTEKDTEREMKFHLQKIETKEGVDITIWTPNYPKNEKFFKDKRDELNNLKFFLKQPSDIIFTIHLNDKDGKVDCYKMEGSFLS
jgi:retron-type reverse transcriptase